ncbi:NAD-dependent epimerase/dehydratase family protein [Alphaproteobacteria bacterium]|nr:NAD-dependent epimerase/dehydratase family protein [Alphaproteobacteria bacterium]
MKKNVIITGGAGFIGSNLVEFILKRKLANKIYVIDNYSSGSKKNHINNKAIKYIKNDTRNIFNIRHFSKIKIDYIFHLAEFSRIVQSFEYFDNCWESNVQGTKKIIEFALHKNAKLVYSASSSKFGSENNQYLSPYAWTKAKNVELIKCYKEWYGLKYVICYFYNVYGPRQIKNHYMSAVIGIFENQYLNNEPLTVVSPGNQKRDFTHVYDIVDGFVEAGFNKINQEYQLASGKLLSLLQVAKMFNHKIKMIPKRPGERWSSKRDSLIKSKRDLKFKPKYSLSQYIKDFLNSNKKIK